MQSMFVLSVGASMPSSLIAPVMSVPGCAVQTFAIESFRNWYDLSFKRVYCECVCRA